MKRDAAVTYLVPFVLFCLLVSPLTGQAQTPAGSASRPQKAPALEPRMGKIARLTDKGIYSLAVVIEGNELSKGANSIELHVLDRHSRPVPGAEITAIPWLPSTGHEVNEKAVVRELGQGKYRITNIVFDQNGFWDLKITVRKSDQADRAALSFSVGMGPLGKQGDSDRKSGKYTRTVEYYNIPNMTLLNQDGDKVKLKPFLTNSDKPVIIDFIFTTCTTICPVLSAGFASIRNKLGKDASSVRLVSLSIDPENDRPEQMKKYLAQFRAGEGWDFLTGSYEDIDRLMQIFACKADKMNHQPLYLLHSPKSETWVRIEGLVSSSDLMNELKSLGSK